MSGYHLRRHARTRGFITRRQIGGIIAAGVITGYPAGRCGASSVP